MAKKGRRRRKKGPSNKGGAATVTLQPGEVPTDEELEAEARALESEIQTILAP